MDEESIMACLVRIETILERLDSNFTNHLEHHRISAARDVDRLHKWIYFLISTCVLVASAAYYLGKN